MVGLESIDLRLRRGVIITFLGRIVTLAIGLATNAFLARLLTGEELGLYFLALSLMTFASTMSNMGLGPIMVREVAASLVLDNQSRAKQMIIACFWRVILASTLISLFIAHGSFVISAFSPMLVVFLPVIAMWGLLISAQNYISDALRGIHQIGWATMAGGLWSGFWFLMVLSAALLFGWHLNLHQLLMVVSAAVFSALIMFGLILCSKLKPWEKETESEKLNLFHHSFPVWAISIQALVFSQADIWIVATLVGERGVAIYGGALRVSLLAGLPLIILTTLLPPFISELHASNRVAELEVLVRKLSMAAAVPVVFFLIVCWFWGAQALTMIFGGEYSAGKDILMLLVLGQLVSILCGPSGAVLTMTGHQKGLMQVTIFSSTLTLLAAYWGGMLHGAIGVAAGVLLGQILHNVFMLIVVKHRLGIWTHISIRPLTFHKHGSWL